jgi:hypothetical protein
LPPERAQRDEGGDQHDRGAPEEEPSRNGQVADAAEGVRDDQGRTSSCAI